MFFFRSEYLLTPIVIKNGEKLDNPQFQVAVDALGNIIVYMCLQLGINSTSLFPPNCLLLNLNILYEHCKASEAKLKQFRSFTKQTETEDTEEVDVTDIVACLSGRYKCLPNKTMNAPHVPQVGESDWLYVELEKL
jgi:hypothetical protein